MINIAARSEQVALEAATNGAWLKDLAVLNYLLFFFHFLITVTFLVSISSSLSLSYFSAVFSKSHIVYFPLFFLLYLPFVSNPSFTAHSSFSFILPPFFLVILCFISLPCPTMLCRVTTTDYWEIWKDMQCSCSSKSTYCSENCLEGGKI
jgi:hypothetical protein